MYTKYIEFIVYLIFIRFKTMQSSKLTLNKYPFLYQHDIKKMMVMCCCC
jgi:hypothetical protein